MTKLEKHKIKTKPPETIKHGQLKTDRKTRHQPLLIEDLASLEDLNQQIVVDMLCKRFMRYDLFSSLILGDDATGN